MVLEQHFEYKFSKYVQYFMPNRDVSLTYRKYSEVHWELRLRRSVSK